MKKYKITRIMHGGYLTEEIIVEADTEEQAEEISLTADLEDWTVVKELEFKDAELITEKIG
ncbi:MAG: hypothetical protein H8E36_09910 [Rhodospirillaceae bacterium]|nr:hypothetical protein [Rhodospirillaceae bacterium]MBL6930695.1 hypothetical protein [Rhodospirillales bacterium]MBL6940526.1 hypothetical protein [Rhodospirillales bacterium]